MPGWAHPVIHQVAISRVVVLACVALLAVGPVGCSSTTVSDVADGQVDASFADAIIIDVRTPEEFAAGHLDGALLYNVQDPSFEANIAALDATATYVVYCRSGNRSAQAIERMKAVGFTTLTDLGSLQNASDETGIAIVQD
jgi:phage shock protein E